LKKIGLVFAQGIGLGAAVGLCLAGGTAILYQAVHTSGTGDSAGSVTVYFLTVGFLLGLLSGWALALKTVFSNALGFLFVKIAEGVPVPESPVGTEWSRKMEGIFREALQPMPPLFRRFVNYFMVSRFHQVEKINRFMEKAGIQEGLSSPPPDWRTKTALRFFLRPLRAFFNVVHAILFLVCCFFWALPFFR
jgi:hypothetical protein